MTPSLLVLAAGLSQRYGGTKQLEAVGPAGETLLDYAVHDARRHGFGRVLLVIRAELEPAFRSRRSSPAHPAASVEYVSQRHEDVPPGVHRLPPRDKPWGTGQAVLAAARHVVGPFAVINGDDFYGASSFARLHAALADRDFALVGFRLGDTLSNHGGVSRGICRCDPGGYLEELREATDIRRTGSAIVGRGGSGESLSLGSDALVSMNMWGFTPAVFPLLYAGFTTFLETQGDDPTAEFLLPDAVNAMVSRREARVRVLPGHATWFGITHPGDRARARARLRALTERGEYPAPLPST